MEITAKMVKELREKTGAGMMKCKNALKETNGNFEEAIDYLRKKGLASADKRSGRATSEGLVVPVTSEDRRTAAILEINCESDFVARNDKFSDFSNKLIKLVLDTPSIKNVEDLKNATIDGKSVEEERKVAVATIGENISFGRLERFEFADGENGIFDTYIHDGGVIGVLVKISADSKEAANNAETLSYAHEVALQTAAMRPLYVNSEKVPSDIIAREKEVILGQIKNDPKNANKPPEIMEKIIQGRIAKYYKEFCLVEQAYVKDDSKTIKSLGEEISKKIGGTIKVTDFRRWALGESNQSSTATEEKSAEVAG